MTQVSWSERNWRSDAAMASAGRWTAICPGSHTMESRSKCTRRCCTARVRASVVLPDPELPKTRTLMILDRPAPNENKMSDGHRERESLEVEGALATGNVNARRVAVRPTWLGLGRFIPSNLVREKVDSGVPARGKLQFPLPPLRHSTRPCTGRSRRHLTKRSHRCQRVHIVPPLHDLSALDGNDRDEPVVV
jgi:hypothetical protein